MIDTLGRFSTTHNAFGIFMDPSTATSIGSALASMLIYVVMAFVLFFRPTGLFGLNYMTIKPDEFLINAVLIIGLAVAVLIAKAVDEPFIITMATKVAIFAIAGVGLNLALGYGGLVSFGHAAYFGIGGYVAGILASHAFNYEPLMNWPMEVSGTTQMLIIWPVAIVISSLVALLIGSLVASHKRCLFHHDNAGLCPDDLLFRDFMAGLWR